MMHDMFFLPNMGKHILHFIFTVFMWSSGATSSESALRQQNACIMEFAIKCC